MSAVALTFTFSTGLPSKNEILETTIRILLAVFSYMIL